MNTIYQHPKDLVLALFDGEPRHPMRLLKSTRIKVGVWDVHMHIIGESHAVIISKNNKPIFSETLSCVPVPPSRCEYHHTFQTLQPHSHQRDGYGVMVDFNTPYWQIPYPTNRIEVTFPPMFNQAPITRIQWQQQGDCFQWWTLHVYPQQTETICVYTTSYFNFYDTKEV